MNSMVLAQEWERALSLFSEVKQAPQLRPSQITYNTAIIACEHGQNWTLALHLLDEAFKALPQPDAPGLAAAMRVCAKAQQWARALHLWSNAQQAELLPDMAVYDAAIYSHAKGRQWTEALQLSAELVQADWELSEISYRGLLSACAEQWVTALHLLSRMQQESLRPNALDYGEVVSACVRCQEMQTATRLLRSPGLAGERR
eukprot:CAMPEP_0171284748 /NCGR_PEP_ID=MMETSP0790-20130122/68101_1 /TAXON_ID=2925 /ORGANISM="Alexandrium catenella, Strain OF101" /LENGTH=201 /DNA_ID=CAMNT_0011754059 /DNA_START=8 /DNA_END=609 /DNA_ORIENTATION=-